MFWITNTLLWPYWFHYYNSSKLWWFWNTFLHSTVSHWQCVNHSGDLESTWPKGCVGKREFYYCDISFFGRIHPNNQFHSLLLISKRHIMSYYLILLQVILVHMNCILFIETSHIVDLFQLKSAPLIHNIYTLIILYHLWVNHTSLSLRSGGCKETFLTSSETSSSFRMFSAHHPQLSLFYQSF